MNEAQNQSSEDVLQTLDRRFLDERVRWNKFFLSLKESHPLATSLPDEHLVEAIQSGFITKGRALDMGCGNGRNAIYLAQQGFQVDANDISEEAIQKAQVAAACLKVSVNFMRGSFLELNADNSIYDLIYDFGCLHHIHPHRRPQYINFVSRSLKPNGIFALGCFNEKMGTQKSDSEILTDFDMEGGLSFTPERLHSFFDSAFELSHMREMRPSSSEAAGVGWDHMRVSIWKRKER